MTPALRYTLARFGLFLAAAVLLWSGAGALGWSFNGIPLLLAALLLSSVASLFLLSRQREGFAQALADKRQAKAEEIAERQARLRGPDGAQP